MVNKVIVLGRLTVDPEVKTHPKGILTRLRLATSSYSGKEEDGTAKETTEYHTAVCFGRTAEVAGDYLKKGRLVFIEGHLHTSSWEGPDKQKRYATEIQVDSLKMVGPRPADTVTAEARASSAA